MGDTLVGSWTLESGQSYEEFLVAIGIPTMFRKVLLSYPPEVTFTNDDQLNAWTRVEKSLHFTNTETYSLSHSYLYTRVDGREFPVFAEADGENRQIHTSSHEGAQGEDATVT